MYQTINFSQFVDSFVDMGRQSNFATHYDNGEPVGWYEGLRVLFDYLEGSHSIGGYELDVIALCCDFSHDTALDIVNSYDIQIVCSRYFEEEVQEAALNYLNDTGTLIGETEYGFVYRQH